MIHLIQQPPGAGLLRLFVVRRNWGEPPPQNLPLSGFFPQKNIYLCQSHLRLLGIQI
jgi:hypothetical protein